MKDNPKQRAAMVEAQIARRGVLDPHVLNAMREVPRERFVDDAMLEFAYEDSPLPIAEGQTISQPYIVAVMIEAAEIRPGDRVLEIGCGSGYAAAVISRIADDVFTIDRHVALVDVAQARFDALGYDNIETRAGDGTLGWPDAAPFDAILVAAGGPEVPQRLREQLEIGGRLVIPVGDSDYGQRLVKMTRRSASEFDEDDLGAVAFVPLIGEQGWKDGLRSTRSLPEAQKAAPTLIAEAAERLPDIDDPTFGEMFDRFGDAKVVLLGEASHGTSEFYRARAAITRRLIERHGFTIVAVEADWPDAATIDRQVRGQPPLKGTEPPFRRFPTWMWRNTEVKAFTDWLTTYNKGRDPDAQAGFYGLDLYNLSGSIEAVIGYLDKADPAAADVARERYGCLTPWASDPAVYGRISSRSGFALCEDAVVRMLRELLDRKIEYTRQDGASFLDAAQNARLVKSAERYYRVMYHGAAESWNLRDTHMFDTLEQLLAAKGASAKAVVWAHNSHIGNAAYTDMGAARDEINIGQLMRERYGEQTALIGFGTHSGTVAAATNWDGPMEVKQVRPSRADSYERVCHDSGIGRFLLDLREGRNDATRAELLNPRRERFIGVIYRPETELQSHYSFASLPMQFDAYVWFDKTSAVTPLPTRQREGAYETYPFGL